MPSPIFARFVSTVLLAGLLAAFSPVQAASNVCPDPSAPCHSPHKHFTPYELSFHIPRQIKPNVGYKSTPFYAIVIYARSSGRETDCDGGEYSSSVERDRKKAQALFPKRKTFADQQCPDMGAVSYIIDGKPNTQVFIGVYAGKTRAEAQRVLAQAKKRYPNAKIRRMQVVFERIVQ